MRRSVLYGSTASAVNFMAATDGPTWARSPLDAVADFTATRFSNKATRLFLCYPLDRMSNGADQHLSFALTSKL